MAFPGQIVIVLVPNWLMMHCFKHRDACDGSIYQSTVMGIWGCCRNHPDFSFLSYSYHWFYVTMGSDTKELSQSISNLSLSTVAKRRMRTSKEEMIILEHYFSQNRNPNNEQKKEIAKAVQMTEKSVHFWYVYVSIDACIGYLTPNVGFKTEEPRKIKRARWKVITKIKRTTVSWGICS